MEHDDLLAQLAAHRHTLAQQLTQRAYFGAGSVPPHIDHTIAEAREAIARIKAALRGVGVGVDDAPNDDASFDTEPGHSHAGAALLATLPLDVIPEPAALPPGSRMPLARNPLFTGRTHDLKHLAAAVKGGGTAAIGQVAAATGLGGIGKTQLAAEFAHRYGQFFAGGVFWLSFADPATVPSEVAACGGPGALNLPGFDALALDAQAARVAQEWQSPLPRLLIFDNCEDEALLAAWRPSSGGSRVLVTSRRARWDASLAVQPLPLATLPRAESIALLRKFRPDLSPDDPDLAAIAAELGDLPLALHLAGSFLRLYRADISPAAYLAELRSAPLLEHESLQGVDLAVSPTAHDLHVSRTFALSEQRLDRAEPVDAQAIQLLARAACFALGEPLPRALLLASVELPDASAQRRASRAIGRLIALGLLEAANDDALRMHRLLGVFVGALATDAAAVPAVEQAILDEANRLNNARIPAPLLELQSHLRWATERAIPRADALAASLCNTLGHHLWIVGDYAGARPYLEQALAIRKDVLGERHLDTAQSLNNLGVLLQAQGDLPGTRPYLEQALAIRKDVLGERHADTAQTLNNPGVLLRAQGDYAGARPYYEQALAIRKHVLGERHPDTALSLNNLGALLQAQGDYAGARPCYEQALAICETSLGRDHPTTRIIQANLAALNSASQNPE